MLFVRNPFKGKKPGSRCKFMRSNGLRLVNGRPTPEYKEASGRVVMVFDTHVVVNCGGKHGTPYVVDENNFVK